MVSRVKASSVHLSASAMIALLTLLLVFQLWYPSPLHDAVGVTHIFLLLLLVDVGIGPLLTLLVYRQGKKGLVFDLAIIILLQLSALGYGLWSVAEGRPAWLVLSVDRFDLVRVLDIDERKLGEAAPEFSRPSWWGPRWVGVAQPYSPTERDNLMFESVLGGHDLSQRPELYRPLAGVAASLKAVARSLEELRQYNASEQVGAVLSQWPDADGWLPLKSNAQSMTVLVNKESAKVIAIVDLRPWQD